MASADVLYLDQILEQMSNPHLEQHQTPLQGQKIKSLQETLNFLLDFLDDSRQRRSEELRCLERELRDAACKAADIIELHILKNFDQAEFHERQIRDQTFCEDFEIVADEVDSIKTKAAKLKELWGATDLHHSQRTSLSTGPSRLASSGKNAMVREDLEDIMGRLTGYPPALQTIQITGMGGIGKTTLARNVYNNRLIEEHFHTRAWVSISQEYREREVLMSLLEQLRAEPCQGDSTEEELKENLYKSLKGRRYLVVMDDVWTTEAWNSLRMIFPDDRNGSRIMLTTRLTSSLVHESSHSYLHRMQFLDKTDSWDLLRRNVFGEDSCPSELEEAGKKIAENCKGLPLSLVVIGGHLSKANRTKHHWEDVAENVKAVVNAEDANCSGILSLSYNHLPHYLKPCFLYMGVFPEDDKIRVSKLIRLWVAEGFLKPVRGKMLEEVAEEYLGDLISRNLIMISKKSSRGKIKTCGIHDMLRDLCLKKAQEEKFFHVRDKDNIFAESKDSRRLCIHPDILHEEFKCYQSMGSLPAVRSIFSGFPSISYSEGGFIFPKGLDESQINELVDGKLFPLLRVLDLKQHVGGFPFGEIKLVHSRYLAFPSCNGKVSMPKTLPDFLGHLQTLIVDSDGVHLPEEIWRMPQLRHLLFGMCFLPCPTRSQIDGENLALRNLLTLSKVSSSSFNKVFDRVPNLKKLGIFSDHDDKISLGILVNLPQLETLKIKCSFRVPINFTFPPNIKKLTLEDCKIAWKHMTIVGSMPNLEVFKLLDHTICRPKREEWEPTKGEFPKLKFLLLRTCFLVQWRANETNFRSLECLMLRKCYNLKEIPCSFGDILTLQIIDLDDVSTSAVASAKQIQAEQVGFGNDSFQVRVERMPYRQQVLMIFRTITRDHVLSHGVLSHGVLMPLLEQLNDKTNLTIMRQATETLSKLCLGKPQFEQVKSAILPLAHLIHTDDQTVLEHACEALFRLTCGEMDMKQAVIDAGVFPRLFELLLSVKKSLGSVVRRYSKSYILSVLIVDNIISYVDDTQIQVIIDNGSLPCLCEVLMLNSDYDDSVKEATCHIISNITGRTKDHIQAVIEAGIISPLLPLLQDANLFNAAAEVIYNVTTKGTNEQISFLVHKGCIEPMCDLLVNPNEAHVIKIYLEGLENILKVGEAEKIQGNTEDVNVFAQMIVDAGGLEKIKNLQTHDNSKIREQAGKILETYW